MTLFILLSLSYAGLDVYSDQNFQQESMEKVLEDAREDLKKESSDTLDILHTNEGYLFLRKQYSLVLRDSFAPMHVDANQLYKPPRLLTF